MGASRPTRGFSRGGLMVARAAVGCKPMLACQSTVDIRVTL